MPLSARLAVLTALVLAALAGLGLEFDRRIRTTTAREAALQRMQMDHARMAAGISELFDSVARRADELAGQIRDARPDAGQLEAMLRARVLHDPTVGGVLVALEAGNYLRDTPYSLHASYTPQGFRVIDFYNSKEFTFHYLPTRRWYRQIIDEKQPFWSSAYFNDTGGGQDVVSRDAPLNLGALGQGALNFDLSLDRVEVVARTLGFERETATRRSLLMDSGGRLVLHWQSALERASLVTDAGAQQREPLLRWFAKELSAQDSRHEARDVAGGGAELLLSTAVGSSGWRIGSVERVALSASVERSRWLLAGLSIVFGSLLVFFLVRRVERPLREFAAASERFSENPTDGALATPREAGVEVQRIATAFARIRELALGRRERELKETAALQRQLGRSEALLAVQAAVLPDDRLFFGSQLELEAVGRVHAVDCRDFFGCLSPVPGVCVFFLGTAAESGVAAVVTMTRVLDLMPALLRAGGATPDLMQKLREAMAQDDRGAALGAFLLGRIDLNTGALEVSGSSAAQPPILIDGEGTQRRLDFGADAPALAGTQSPFPLWRGQMNPGDHLLCYSQGLVAQAGAAYRTFGLDGLQIALERHREAVPRNQCEAILAEWLQHVGAAAAQLDASLLVLELRHHD